MSVQVYRRHEACENEDGSRHVSDIMTKHLQDCVGCVCICEDNGPHEYHDLIRKQRRQLTHPSVIKERSSVNSITSSSSSIAHVSLVECCFGINNVVTTKRPPLSFPRSSPHVSRFRAVFIDAIDVNRLKQSRGNETDLSSRATGSEPPKGGATNSFGGRGGRAFDPAL